MNILAACASPNAKFSYSFPPACWELFNGPSEISVPREGRRASRLPTLIAAPDINLANREYIALPLLESPEEVRGLRQKTRNVGDWI